MKPKGSIFISCLVAGALIASPALGKSEKKSADASTSKPKRMSPHTTQVTPSYRYHQNRQNTMRSRTANSRYYAVPSYTGTRSYGVRQYSGTNYYGATPYYGGNTYYGGTRYYYGDGSYPYDSYYSGWPNSNWVTQLLGGIHTRTQAVIRTAVTAITILTTRQLTATTDHWLPPFNDASVNSATTTV